MTTTPPGWYDDGQGAQRWWDGSAWTEHVQTLPEVPADAAAAEIFHPGGAALPEAPKSRLWILWVVLGVVVVGLVVAAAVLIPIVMGMLSRGFAPPPVTASTPDEEAAAAAVELYDDAWANGDCDAYMATTTEEFRFANQIIDCATFDEAVGYFDASTDDYDLTVMGFERSGDAIIVTTREDFTLLVDEAGEPLDEPQVTFGEYSYTVVQLDGAWLIDDLTS